MPSAAETAAGLRRTRPEWLPNVFPNGKTEGSIFYIGNADGDAGRSLPIPLDPGKGEILADFGGGFQGDDLDLYARGRRLELSEAMAEAACFLGIEGMTPQQTNGFKQKRTDMRAGQKDAGTAIWEPVLPVPDDAPRTIPSHRLGKPSAEWAYRDANGDLLGMKCRFDRDGGGKDVLPLVFARNTVTGEAAWRWQAFPSPRPLYGLDRLAARPGAPVLVVEGEKTTDAAAILFPGHVAVTSPSGSKAADKADWSALAGRRVVIWPDHDEPGRSYAEAVARLALAAGATSVAVVQVPAGWLDAWDLADEPPPGVTVDDLRAMLENAVPFDAAPQSRLRLVPFDQIGTSTNSNAFVKGLLGSAALSVVYGESGAGKTFWVLDLALHVALGRDWRGRRVRQGGVIYVAAEGAAGISNRVAAFKSHQGIAGSAPFAVLPASVNLLDPKADTDELISLVNSAATRLGMPVALVVVDTLSRALAGGNENSPEDMGALVMNADRIREATGAHVMFVHHSGKDGARGARGHSLLRAAVDTEIEVSRDPASKVCTAKVTKAKELPADGEFAFTLEIVPLGVDEDGDPLTSCVAIPAEGEARPVQSRKLPDHARSAMEVLTDTLAREGMTAPGSMSDHIPAGTRVVTVAALRESFYNRTVDDEKPDTKKKRFARAIKSLQGNRMVGVWKDYIWLTTSQQFSNAPGRGTSGGHVPLLSRVPTGTGQGHTPIGVSRVPPPVPATGAEYGNDETGTVELEKPHPLPKAPERDDDAEVF
ncbi:AAA family ATPase [Roseomonas genomospecies 6]|nr:AAA family ATPase [Roseomonas genomospecies 6]